MSVGMRHTPIAPAVVLGFATLLAAGCLGSMPAGDSPTGTGGAGATPGTSSTPPDDAGVAATDLGAGADSRAGAGPTGPEVD